MDKKRRSRLKSVVGQARRIVEDDVRVQLRRLGIDENEIKPVERLPHLSVEDKELRAKVVKAIEKEKAGDISYDEAFDRYVRHVGFTYMNRIAALRAMEVRNLIKETVIRRADYGGHSKREYELSEREHFSDPYELLRAGLVEAFNEVGAEIRVLFDVNSEYCLVFLGHKALLELIKLLSEEVPEDDWKEDDAIGWIYQYYNEEARAEFKRAKRKPKADDIPVINQFYTPRWVVRVLVDNTLGRLWLEMNGRCLKLGDPVKRTREQLENPSGDKVDDFCSYLVPLGQEPPPREKKRVREIKILDPACGSGHFLVYAFDVLYRMYREDEPDTSVEEIPRLILENNLFGIDIDLRAVQLAALSLYLKAKWYNPKLKISKMGLVCADARITDGKVRKVFLERFADDPELQRIFAKIFEDLEFTYEIGSLLKVREPFEKLLERRRREGGVQAVLVPKIEGQTAISSTGRIEAQTKLNMKVVEDRTATQIIAVPREVTLEQMFNALKEFEKEAMEKRDMGTLLFATEAEKSVGLLALLSEKYDALLMNPPYGDVPPETKKYLRSHYPKTHFDYYAAFIEQVIDLAQEGSYVGALTGRTFMFLKSYQWVREALLQKRAPPQVVLDLGFGVLDVATARWAAFTAHKSEFEGHPTTFLRLTECIMEEERQTTLQEILAALENGKIHRLVHQIKIYEFAQIPGMPYSYWVSPSLRSLFTQFPPLDRDAAGRPEQTKIADAKQGLATGDDARFTRQFWEVPNSALGRGLKWVPFANRGGTEPFYADISLVVNWENDGKEIKDFRDANGKLRSRPQNEQFFFQEGLSWALIVSSSRLCFRILPKDVIIGVHGSSAFLSNEQIPGLLSLGNSILFAFLFMALDPLMHVRHVGYMSRLPINSTALSSEKLKKLGLEAHDLMQELATGLETSTIFAKPPMLQVLHGFSIQDRPIVRHPIASRFKWSNWPSAQEMRAVRGSPDMSMNELAEICVKRQQMQSKRIDEIQREIDEEVYRIYGISDEDKALIERELGFQQRVSLEEEVANKEVEEPSKDVTSPKEHIERLISFYIKKAVENDEDGMVPLDEMFSDNLLAKVRELMMQDFGKEKSDKVELEMSQILGKSLRRWIEEDYFDFHVSLYRGRPIFWHLTSSNFSRIRGSKGAFNIFTYYHKLDPDTIPKIRVILKQEMEIARRNVERHRNQLQQARQENNKRKERQLSEDLETAVSIFEELEAYDKALETVYNPRQDKTKLPKNPTWLQEKTAELRDQGWRPIIDYGVRVNIEPLKEAGLLHQAAVKVR
jgi:hypothetical protein